MFAWALQSTMAEIVIFSYASSMIFSGLFSILVYTKGQVKSILMQVYVIINSIYAVGAIAIICLALSISYSEKYNPYETFYYHNNDKTIPHFKKYLENHFNCPYDCLIKT